MAEKLKETLTATQLGENQMLVTSVANGITVYLRQDIKDIDTSTLTRKKKIISANILKLADKIKAKKDKTDKTSDIEAFVTKAKEGK